VFKKNISDGVGSRNESIATPLYPPLFWLDNIFNKQKIALRALSKPFAAVLLHPARPMIYSIEKKNAKILKLGENP
jgi:hypothetical protein